MGGEFAPDTSLRKGYRTPSSAPRLDFKGAHEVGDFFDPVAAAVGFDASHDLIQRL